MVRIPSVSSRRPRPCGLTIHPTVGCNVGCSYCYLWEMGLIREPVLNPMRPEKLVSEVRRNPYFVESRMGTFLALGSLGEPFLNPEVAQKTLSYISALKKLGNPIQVSTKFAPPPDSRLAGVNVLITVVVWDSYKLLEPNAPPPWDRVSAAGELLDAGAYPTLFVRPIIPGVTLNELDDMLREASRHGIRSVVFGTLRVSPEVVRRLESSGIDTSEILKRTRTRLRRGLQIYIRGEDLKAVAMERARSLGMIPLGSACCANALANGVPCFDVRWLHRRCTGCPNECRSKIPTREFVENLLSDMKLRGRVSDNEVILGEDSWRRLGPAGRHKLEVLTRRIVIRAGGPGGT